MENVFHRLESGTYLRHYAEIDSTNLEATRLVQAGEEGAFWVSADRQSNGYGRRGRAWQQSAGDLAASLVLPLSEAEVAVGGQLSFLVAIALGDVIRAYTFRPIYEVAPNGHGADKPVQIAYKWPNDVLLNEAKLSGILLELVDGLTSKVMIVGIGVNIVSKPEVPDYPTACLADALTEAPAPTALQLLKDLDAALARWLKVWRREGFEPIRAAWLAQAARLDKEITVRLPNETIQGVFRGIDEHGAMLLETPKGERVIAAGTVFFDAPQ